MIGNALRQFLGQCQWATKSKQSSESVENFVHDGLVSRNGDIQLRNIYVDWLDKVEISNGASRKVIYGGYLIGFKATGLAIRGYLARMSQQIASKLANQIIAMFREIISEMVSIEALAKRYIFQYLFDE